MKKEEKHRYNKDYYNRNRSYILERKRLQRTGSEIPEIETFVVEDKGSKKEIKLFNGVVLQQTIIK